MVWCGRVRYGTVHYQARRSNFITTARKSILINIDELFKLGGEML